jgi:hypothetical protein
MILIPYSDKQCMSKVLLFCGLAVLLVVVAAYWGDDYYCARSPSDRMMRAGFHVYYYSSTTEAKSPSMLIRSKRFTKHVQRFQKHGC